MRGGRRWQWRWRRQLQWRKVAVAAMAGVVAMSTLAACSDDSKRAGAGAGATVPTTARPTTTTDPYAVPAVIDVAYVNKVLGALDAAYGDIVRLIVSDRDISAEARERLNAIYDSDLVELRIASFEKARATGFVTYRTPPGDRKTVTDALIAAEGSCVFARVARDYSDVTSRTDSEETTEWVTLKRKPAGAGAQFNATPWILAYDGFERGGTAPTAQCGES